jgi:hypothetical protein
VAKEYKLSKHFYYGWHFGIGGASYSLKINNIDTSISHNSIAFSEGGQFRYAFKNGKSIGINFRHTTIPRNFITHEIDAKIGSQLIYTNLFFTP